MNIHGKIFNTQHYSIRDGHGIRTVVFLKGCPARCVWCCNPESQGYDFDLYHVERFCVGCGRCEQVCPNSAISIVDGKAEIDREKCGKCFSCVGVCHADAMQKMGDEVTVDEVMKEVMADAPMYETSGGGVTLSGGECLTQPEFALAILEEARMNGISTCIETCGVCRKDVLVEAANLCDEVFMDLKIMDPEKSKRFIGVDSTSILENAAAIAKLPWVSFRIPLIPGINDDEENLQALADFLKESGNPRIKLIPYHVLGVDKYPRLGREYEWVRSSKGIDEIVKKAQAFMEERGIETEIA